MLETTAQRQPDNELFDACCDLAAATHRLKSAARHPEAAPGLVATLGCLDRSLQQLAEGLEALESLAALSSGSSAAPGETGAAVRSLVEAQEELLRCAACLDAARARVGRAMGSSPRRS
jgi:hypothetical protein